MDFPILRQTVLRGGDSGAESTLPPPNYTGFKWNYAMGIHCDCDLTCLGDLSTSLCPHQGPQNPVEATKAGSLRVNPAFAVGRVSRSSASAVTSEQLKTVLQEGDT